jgi:type IV pilus assembly protein PilM
MGLKGLFAKKTKAAVGVDIGSSSVKVVELKKSNSDSLQLQAWGIEALPQDCIVDGVIISKLPVADAITKICKLRGIRNSRASTSISGHSVIVKKLTLPAQNREELDQSIEWEAAQYIPFDVADVNLDYQVMRTHSDSNRMEVILVAAKKDKIADQTSVLSMAGMHPSVVDIDAFALQNVYEINYEPTPATVAALLNIGSSLVNVAILRGSEFLFTRDIALGGSHYNDCLQKELNISFEEAEAYKCGDIDPPEDLRQRMQSIIDSVTENLVLEVQKTLDYFKTTTHSEDVTEIYISGGTSRTMGLREVFEEKFQVPVHFLDPFKKIKVEHRPDSLKAAAPDFAVAVGLALRSAGDR